MNTASNSLNAWFTRHKKRILEVGIGITLYQIFNFICDDILYPVMIGVYGLKGALIMSAFSLIQCAVTLIWYQSRKIDWLGVGAIESIKEGGQEKITKFLQAKKEWLERNCSLFLQNCSLDSGRIILAGHIDVEQGRSSGVSGFRTCFGSIPNDSLLQKSRLLRKIGRERLGYFLRFMVLGESLLEHPFGGSRSCYHQNVAYNARHLKGPCIYFI